MSDTAMGSEAEAKRALEGMEWREVESTLRAAIHELLTNISNPPAPPLPPSPPPPVPAGLEFNTRFQPAASQGGGCIGYMPQGAAPPMMAAPNMYYAPVYQGEFMPPGHLLNQSVYSQTQYLPYHWPTQVPTAAAAHQPAAPQYQYNNAPAVSLPDSTIQNLRPVGVLDGNAWYKMPADVVAPNASAVPSTTKISNSKIKTKHESQQAEERPYVKKPPNAFMLYMKEQRPHVAPEYSSRGSAIVHKHLGEKWKSLTKEQQAKYFDQAYQERWLHEQLHPGWSGLENYGKKRKREKRKAKGTKAKASQPADNTQQAKRLCTTPLQSVTEPSTSPAIEMKAPYPMSGWMLQSNTQAAPTQPVVPRLPDVYEISPASWVDFTSQ